MARWRVAACADIRGIAAAVAAAAHEGDEAVVGAVEFLVGRRHGGRAARGVGVKEPLDRGAPAAVGAGARLGQGGGRGAVEQAANGGVGQLAGALAKLGGPGDWISACTESLSEWGRGGGGLRYRKSMRRSGAKVSPDVCRGKGAAKCGADGRKGCCDWSGCGGWQRISIVECGTSSSKDYNM